MPRIVDPMIGELEQETRTTRRLLERIPETQLSWKPHAKSRSLGQLALHVAGIPATAVRLTSNDLAEIKTFQPATTEPKSVAEITSKFEENIAAVKEYLNGLDDQRMLGSLKVVVGEKQVFSGTRATALRAFLLNHWIHHRGELVVYLRILDVPVPSIYGPTADENPFR